MERLFNEGSLLSCIYNKKPGVATGYLWEENFNNNNNNNINKLQLGCRLVAVIILHVYKIWN